MTQEAKAKKAAALAKEAMNSPLFAAAPKAKAAVLAMADALEAMAHEVEILKIRVGWKGGE